MAITLTIFIVIAPVPCYSDNNAFLAPPGAGITADSLQAHPYLSRTVSKRVKLRSVKRTGAVIVPGKSDGFMGIKFVLNAGLLVKDGIRALAARLTTRIVDYGLHLRRSNIGLVVHRNLNSKKSDGRVSTPTGMPVTMIGEIDLIDLNMLDPDDMNLTQDKSKSIYLEAHERYMNAVSADETLYWTAQMEWADGQRIIALEDARIVERDGIINIFLTVVKKNGSWYSAVTTHNTESFMRNIKKKMDNPDDSIAWNFTPLKKLINDGPCADQNIKNFVPFGNPANGKWYALYRPEDKKNTTIRLAVSETGLAGDWKDDGLYMEMDKKKDENEKDAWIGVSSFIAGPQEGPYEFMLMHTARDVQKSKLKNPKNYDLWLIIADRKNPKKFVTVPIMKAESGQPFEKEAGCWYPGAIYSCGAVLKSFNIENGEYVFDIYYSGSDTAILLAEVSLGIPDDIFSSETIPSSEKFADAVRNGTVHRKKNNKACDRSS
ncbi:MAG: hypothetical protein ABII23_07420 [bacterium]